MGEITASEARKLLTYDPDTGALVWKGSTRRGWNGKPAGFDHDGYVGVRIDRKFHRAHRVIWLMETGSYPPEGMDIDHVNRNRADNRWSNLRLATRAQNIVNSPCRRDNQCGHKGVYYERDRKRWRATIKVNGKQKRIGRYPTIEGAVRARIRAERKYYGEFAR